MRAANGGVNPEADAHKPVAPVVKRGRGGYEEATFKELMFMSLAVLVGITAAAGLMVCLLCHRIRLYKSQLLIFAVLHCMVHGRPLRPSMAKRSGGQVQ